ncbi:MAG: hypothetical protein AABX19_05000 [Nanoarchaeota archaeon]
MPPSFDIIKRNINITEGNIELEKIFKGIKNKAEDLGYVFFEKEQSSGSKKYGEERTFKFYMDREIDPFAKIEISIEFNFDRLEKVKTKFIGDGIVTFVTKIHLDYKNKWGKNKTDRFLYKLYQKIMKWKFESMYIVPGVIEGNQLYGYIKDELEEYS